MSLRLTAALADSYRFERELGQGGPATVYLAEDRSANAGLRSGLPLTPPDCLTRDH
jgi:hypothetical protein